jgi:hypothetical protein
MAQFHIAHRKYEYNTSYLNLVQQQTGALRTLGEVITQEVTRKQ